MADKNDFFGGAKEDEEEELEKGGDGGAAEEEKYKVGGEEYSAEELKNYVELSKRVKEAEEKYNTKYENIWPEYTKTRQELKEARERLEEQEKRQLEKPAAEGEDLSPEEQARQVLTQADRLGLVTRENVNKYVASILDANNLLSECRAFEQEFDGSDGRPEFKTDEVLAHMKETGIKSPEKAYKDLYEEQIDRWKEEQLKATRGKGMPSEGSTAAGGKEPPAKKTPKNESELMEALADAFKGGVE